MQTLSDTTFKPMAALYVRLSATLITPVSSCSLVFIDQFSIFRFWENPWKFLYSPLKPLSLPNISFKP